uniref:Uncharacterized protein n=1 Tax=Arundo donax TaxID=35708 RepID=A0A0A9GBG6_ARUDO
MGGITASSSPSATGEESGAYSSLSASTMEPRISSSLGNSARTLSRHSPAVLPGGTSSDDSATPVRSRARAKKRTFTLTAGASGSAAGFSSAGAAASLGSCAMAGGKEAARRLEVFLLLRSTWPSESWRPNLSEVRKRK